MTELQESLRNCMELIISGKEDHIIGQFQNGVDVDVPVKGRISNDEVFRGVCKTARDWCIETKASFELLDEMYTENHIVIFYNVTHNVVNERSAKIYKCSLGEPVEFFASVIADIEFSKIIRARVYYTTLSLLGKQTRRDAPLNYNKELVMPKAVQNYFDLMREGKDPQAVVNNYAKDGRFLASSLKLIADIGPEALLASYINQFNIFQANADPSSKYYGIHFWPNNCIIDGNRCACEYYLDSVGDLHIGQQAGFAIWTHSETEPDKIYSEKNIDDVVWGEGGNPMFNPD